MGIEDILRKNDEKRGRRSDPRLDLMERELQSRIMLSEIVAQKLIAALAGLRDKALGMPTRLPLAAKPSETPVFIECEGELVRLTLLCQIRVDPKTGVAHCSPIDLSMSRPGTRPVRSQFVPLAPNMGRPDKLGVTEKQFGIQLDKFRNAIESLAHQL